MPTYRRAYHPVRKAPGSLYGPSLNLTLFIAVHQYVLMRLEPSANVTFRQRSG